MSSKTLRAGVFAAVLAGAATLGVISASRQPKPPLCARQPADGGQCLAKTPDGGVAKFGASTWIRKARAFGECEIAECPKEP